MDKKSLKTPVILITGASGFTGMNACLHFASIGMNVVGLIRDSHSQPKSRNNVSYYQCDLLDKQRLQEIAASLKPDYVLHLGGKNAVSESWEHPVRYIEANVMGTVYLLDALRQLPQCRILVAGSRLKASLEAPERVVHPYGLSKGLQQVAARSWSALFKQEIVTAESSNLIGPGPSTGFCALLARHIVRSERKESPGFFRVSARKAVRDFLDVRDAMRAYQLLLEQGESGRAYPVCSGTEQEFGTVVEYMLSLSKSDLQAEIEWGQDGAAVAEQPQRAEWLEARGWSPSISLAQSLSDCLNYFRDREEGKT
ncbi:NAD-dependent epimerase/dehydratase family protein [Paenibacillus sp. P96]|uniref:NAD-dependent epimerase/dehydratase family protein n=1 Tax=Paenibacillus zeirhizosphaerae TaxID=2987519 RepID=A0ABT9FUT3_9BACL|nr:NAD-dependent epimerase/dehydratase family protein [Paenibacillus sp. P96]MDP4098493.1 NAD-dependent epimerase/dehydratase family protein [Paenibacillus sp. P96]